jgi:hypothetical protein
LAQLNADIHALQAHETVGTHPEKELIERLNTNRRLVEERIGYKDAPAPEFPLTRDAKDGTRFLLDVQKAAPKPTDFP